MFKLITLNFNYLNHNLVWRLSLLLLTLAFSVNSNAGKPKHQSPMDNHKLAEIISQVDNKYSGEMGHWLLTVDDVPLRVVTDEHADRMRIMAPIVKTESLNKDELYRLLQANFDSALDSRYSIAQGVVWATFLHPLSTLDRKDFVTGLAQTVNIVVSYGTTYSSGMFIFQGGDSSDLQKEMYERIERMTNAI
ncbi:MAG: type III secretion system chaperone [Agarilytica sp.]